MNMNEKENLINYLISKEISFDRSAILPGEYEVNEDVTIHVQGKIKVGEDFEAKTPNKIDTWKLLAVAFNKLNNVTIDSILTEYVKNGLDEQAKILKDVVTDKLEQLKESTVQTNKGRITCKAIVEVKEITDKSIKG